jgi:hypothetical protein
MARADDWPPLQVLVVIVVGVIGGILGLGWALAQIIPAIGVAAGLATSVAAAGTAGASWLAPVAAIGLGAAGASTTILLLVRVAHYAQKEPFVWSLPVLAIGASLVLDVTKEFAIQSTILRVLLTTLMAFFLVVAGALYHTGKTLWRSIATVIALVPPVALLAGNLDLSEQARLTQALRGLGLDVWIRLAGFLVIAIVAGIIARAAERPDRGAPSR